MVMEDLRDRSGLHGNQRMVMEDLRDRSGLRGRIAKCEYGLIKTEVFNFFGGDWTPGGGDTMGCWGEQTAVEDAV